LSLLLLPVILAGLYGCPYRSPYKLENEPTVLADDVLVGKWATMITNAAGMEKPVRMTVSKYSDYEYDLCLTGNMRELKFQNVVREDTIKGRAFISEAASRQFLNVKVMGRYYIAEFYLKNNKLTILPLCDHFTGKMVKSNRELKQALELHFKTRLYPLYDEDFSLKEMSRVN
jgi:hypothetical protein